MKIYTRNGDSGSTTLLDGKIHKKSERVFDALGALDELNSTLGLLHTIRDKKIQSIILDLQRDLFEVGAKLAGGDRQFDFEAKTTELEDRIDDIEKLNDPLTNFILPGGTSHAAYLHLSRTICRRAERQIAAIDEPIAGKIVPYINRLSDYLFVLARYINKSNGVGEFKWKTA